MAPYLHDPISFSLNFMESSKATIDLLKFADRIINIPMPFAYSHMLSAMVFIFVFISPLLYCSPLEEGSGWATR